MKLSVRLTPHSSNDEIIGFENGVLKIKVRAKPIDNEANEALITVLARYLKLGKGRVSIKSGFASRNKLVEIKGITEFKLG